jgi:hypothetical protein
MPPKDYSFRGLLVMLKLAVPKHMDCKIHVVSQDYITAGSMPQHQQEIFHFDFNKLQYIERNALCGIGKRISIFLKRNATLMKKSTQ